MRRFIVIGLASLPFAANANMIWNGDFELGNTGFTTSYVYVPGTGNATYGLPPVSPASGAGQGMWDEGRYTITDAQPGLWHSMWRNNVDLTGHGNFMLLNGSTSGSSTAWSSPVGTLTDGVTYRFSFDVVTAFAGDTAPASLDIMVGTQQIGFVNAPTGLAQWSTVFIDFTYDDSWGSVLSILNNQSAAVGNDFGIDNITIAEAVPEPFTMALGALGIGAYIKRRRASKA